MISFVYLYFIFTKFLMSFTGMTDAHKSEAKGRALALHIFLTNPCLFL